MIVYYVILFLIAGLAWPLCIYQPSKPKSILFLVINFSYLWCLATFRYSIGFDYWNYIFISSDIYGVTSLAGMVALPYEYGFFLLTKLIMMISTNSVFLYGVYAALVLIPAAVFIYRYCKDIWLSTWLYVTLTFFYTSMNFIRQSLACAVVLMGYRFLRDKKPIPFFLIAIAASSFHKTALIMIPVYFLCHIKINKKLAIAYASLTLIFYITSAQIIDFVTRFVFTGYRGTIYVDTANGFSPVFLVVPVCVFAACLALYPSWQKRCTESTVLFNLMMFSVIIWLFITRHFILERFSMYIYVFVIIALPQAISCLKRPQEEYAQRDELAQSTEKKSNKDIQNKLRTLTQSIKDHQKYYAAAVAAVILITFIYHEFGAQVNGFHGIFPYQSIFS